MKRSLVMLLPVLLYACVTAKNYTAKPWQGKMQLIPGKLECELYDMGGEGIAYHDTDSINNGSGKLNPANGDFLNEFRKEEGVDISFTKGNDIDNNAYNKVVPGLKSLYVGWTKPGEWINYTVAVKETALYQFSLQYTANGDGYIAIDADGKETARSLFIPSTHDDHDTIPWRQWHHWNRIDSLGEISLSKGIHTLCLRIVSNGNMNLDYIVFSKKIN